MRVGPNKVFPMTSRTWHPSSVGARVQAAPEAPPADASARFMLAREIWLTLDKAKDLAREFFRLEADDEGMFVQPILSIQGNIDDGMAGCGALIVGIKEQQERS